MEMPTHLVSVSSDLRIEMVTVTPELASIWLAGRAHNRVLRRGKVAEWKRDMLMGRWRPIPMPIWISEGGQLIDGEHRLTALVEAGLTLPMWVAFNVPTAWRQLVDSGTPRTAADVLTMSQSITSAGDAQSIARLVLMYQQYPETVWSNTREKQAGKQDILEEVESDLLGYGHAIKDAQAVQRAVGAGKYCTRSAYGALHVLVHRYSSDPELWDEWQHGMATGASLSVTDPRLILRNAKAGPRWGGGQSNLMACLRAWEAYIRREDIRQIKTSQRYLPMKAVA